MISFTVQDLETENRVETVHERVRNEDIDVYCELFFKSMASKLENAIKDNRQIMDFGSTPLTKNVRQLISKLSFLEILYKFRLYKYEKAIELASKNIHIHLFAEHHQ